MTKRIAKRRFRSASFSRTWLEVALPAFEGDATAVREAHQQLMATCDAVMLFYGAGDEAWKRTIDNELKKMPGYRGGRPSGQLDLPGRAARRVIKKISSTWKSRI